MSLKNVAIWTLLFFSQFLIGIKGYAQFYTNNNVCIADVQQADGGSGTFTCPSPLYTFDTDPNSINQFWQFGDGSTATGRRTYYEYSSPGNYTVTLRKTDAAGNINTVSKNVMVGTYPQQPKFNGLMETDTTICDGVTLKLDPYEIPLVGNNYSYLWSNGDTTKTIEVDTSGCFSVQVTDRTTGCSRTAKIEVKICLQEGGGGGGAEEWYFGQGATLNFNRSSDFVPTVDTLSDGGDFFQEPDEENVTFQPGPAGANQLNSPEATAMVYGPTGALVLYTDGVNLFDANDTQILDAAGVGLVGDNQSTQGLAIIPKVSCIECEHHEYYVYAIDTTTGILSYSIVDMRLNGAQGQIREKNIPVQMFMAGNMTVVPLESGFQIIAHQQNNATFEVLNVDSAGVFSTQVNIGTPYADSVHVGYLAMNQSFNKLAHGVVINGENYLEILDYDPATLALSNPKQIKLDIPAPPTVYGVSFSPSGDLVYATISGDPALGQQSFLLQVPIFLTDTASIRSAIIRLDSSTTEQYGALQGGPVNADAGAAKFIYMPIKGTSKLAYIQLPDLQGNASIVGLEIVRGVDVMNTVGLGLPTVVYAAPVQSGDGLAASYFGTCFGSLTTLNIQKVCDPMRNKFIWEFEDGSTQTGENVVYQFPKTGWNKFKIRIKIYNPSFIPDGLGGQIPDFVIQATETECMEVIREDSIFIKPKPIIDFNGDYFVCSYGGTQGFAEVKPIVTGGNTFTYDWTTIIGTSLAGDPTSKDQTIKVAADYVLNVENDYFCTNLDTLVIEDRCDPIIEVPTAFTPNGDGKNDTIYPTFKFVGSLDWKIYNRWGELVYQTDNSVAELAWDGTSRGVVLSPSLYTYVLEYDGEYSNQAKQKKVGYFWLLK